jgi:hypothetical protein
MNNRWVIICFIFLLSGCISQWDRKLKEKNLPVVIQTKSQYFSSRNVNLKITEYKKILAFELDYYIPSSFHFPIDTIYGDTLNETNFHITFKCNGKPITIDKRLKNYKGYYSFVCDSDRLTISFNKQKIKSLYHAKLELPLTIFHDLKKGKQKIEADIYAHSFTSSHYDSQTHEIIDLEAQIDSICGNATFELTIPPMYLTILYGYGLELRNDKEFSPIGMDFSFRLGLPDVYWQIFVPSTGEKDYSFPFWRSGEATYSTGYHKLDTVYLYLFSKNEKIKIGIYDRDDFSTDDFLGDWYGSVSSLVADSVKTLSFDNIKWFKIKAIQKESINN